MIKHEKYFCAFKCFLALMYRNCLLLFLLLHRHIHYLSFSFFVVWCAVACLLLLQICYDDDDLMYVLARLSIKTCIVSYTNTRAVLVFVSCFSFNLIFFSFFLSCFLELVQTISLLGWIMINTTNAWFISHLHWIFFLFEFYNWIEPR